MLTDNIVKYKPQENGNESETRHSFRYNTIGNRGKKVSYTHEIAKCGNIFVIGHNDDYDEVLLPNDDENPRCPTAGYWGEAKYMN